ncbi:MAG: AAA family ATPase [Clostridia bacterium]|nr:AAA family ATPase [Clostridia bacterium]MDD4386890.1 AAA family ATPase [Clostridia bacterium]
MKNTKELTIDELKSSIDLKMDFKSTKEIEPFYGIIGQERALKSITSAMKIKNKGFNLYVCGSLGIGKTSYVLSVINKLAEQTVIPNDYCYIYNFNNPNEPLYVSLEPGMGYELKTDMNQFISKLLLAFATKLSGDTYEKEKKDILDRYAKIKQKILDDFDKYTFTEGFKIKYDKEGISFSPVFKGNIIDEKEFNNLTEVDRKYFKDKSSSIQQETVKILKQLDELDTKAEVSIKEWESNIATFSSTQCIKDLKLKYKNNLKLQNYFYSIQSDIVKNVEFFKQYQIYIKSKNNPDIKSSENNKTNVKVDFPFDNYKVNVIIDNDSSTSAPVILCKSPNYFDLFGKLEFETSNQGVKTDYTMLKPGLIHKANGGYIIINVKDILASVPTWEALKRTLRNSEISIDSARDINQPITINSLKPEPIPMDVQFVLIGSEMNYIQLSKLDPDFKKLFKIKAEFEDTLEKNTSNLQKFCGYISFICKKYNLLSFNHDAVIKIIEYSSKIAGDKNKLTSNLLDLLDLLIECNYTAKENNKKIITSKDVIETIKNKKYRYSLYDDNLSELISDGSVIISTNGEKIGQINGLTIINTGDFMFGKPVRITANTFVGKSGIVNIEREVAMSGTTHSKGVYILSAYIGEKYAQDFPLSLTASICFEQLYNGVDGDSASSTELYAILSSLSSVPIKQNFAVTGSVNQKGEIQPIGGVNDKIDGYYNVCKDRGLDGSHSVLIPYQNVKNLSLSDEILEAIKDGKFHIYPISTIDEGIELLTGIKFGELLDDNTYEKESINYLVYNKLKKYATNSKVYNN